MQKAAGSKKGKSSTKKSAARQAAALTLQKPPKISGKPAWFKDYYEEGSQQEDDREIFST